MSCIYKKISVFILLSIVAAPIIFFIGFTARQQLIRNDMKQQLEISSLCSITVPLNSFNWNENDKEVLLNGKFFDIASYNISNGQITFHGLFDKEEDNFSRDIKSVLTTKQESNSECQDLAIKFILLPLYIEHQDSRMLDFSFSGIKYSTPPEKILHKIEFAVTVPPPQV